MNLNIETRSIEAQVIETKRAEYVTPTLEFHEEYKALTGAVGSN